MPNFPHVLSDEDRQRFWSYVDIQQEPDACWPWLGGIAYKKYGGGYGAFNYRYNNRGVRNNAHRIAWALHYNGGIIPVNDIVIRHSCDFPRCCNPAHLLHGTQKQNMQDAVNRDRFKRGGK